MFSLLSFTFLFIGCPEPVAQNGSNQGMAPGAPKDGPASQASNSTPTSVTGDQVTGLAVAPPKMGTFPGDLAESEVKPRFTQEELADGAKISGYVKCDDCQGKILVRALPPPPENNDEATADEMRLITQATIEKAGNFSLLVPKNSTVVLQVVDDVNGDGVPSQGERMGMRGSGPLSVEGAVEGIELTVGIFPQKEPGEMNLTPTPPSPGTGGEAGAEGAPAGMEGQPAVPPTEGAAGGATGGAPGVTTPPSQPVTQPTVPPTQQTEPSTPPAEPKEDGPPKDDGEGN